jgi:hypothetical protein
MTKTAMQMIGEAQAQVGTVEPEKAADELGAGAVFVDVREPEEWQHGHIDGSMAAHRGLLEFFADPVVCYLTGGDRAKAQLDSPKDWLAVHNDAVMTVLFLVLGVNLIAKGIPPLT